MNLSNLSSNIDSFVNSFEGESIDSQTYELTDREERNRKILRWSILAIVVLSVSYVIYKRKKK